MQVFFLLEVECIRDPNHVQVRPSEQILILQRKFCGFYSAEKVFMQSLNDFMNFASFFVRFEFLFFCLINQ